MGISTNRERFICAGNKTFGSFKIEFRASGIYKVVVGYFLGVPAFTFRNIFGNNERFVNFRISFWMEGYHFSLLKINSFFLIQRRQGEKYFLRLHSAHSYPNIRRDPLIVTVG